VVRYEEVARLAHDRVVCSGEVGGRCGMAVRLCGLVGSLSSDIWWLEVL
jgi:hypothetical protein